LKGVPPKIATTTVARGDSLWRISRLTSPPSLLRSQGVAPLLFPYSAARRASSILIIDFRHRAQAEICARCARPWPKEMFSPGIS
jgi:hypothetical protein